MKRNTAYFVQDDDTREMFAGTYDLPSSLSKERCSEDAIRTAREHFREESFDRSPLEPLASCDSGKEVILLISVNPATRSNLHQLLRKGPYRVLESSGDDHAISTLNGDTATVLIDVCPQGPHTDLLCKQIKEKDPELPIIVVDEPERPSEYRRAVYPYCQEYLTKPCDRAHLLTALEQNVRYRKLSNENRSLRELRGLPLLSLPLVGTSPVSQTLNKQIEAFGRLDNTVLITGEHGVGKNVVAQQIHQASRRAKQPFLVIPCSSVTSNMLEADLFGCITVDSQGRQHERIGRLELISGGTVYLDHIDQLSPHLQSKLLHYLQEKTFRPIGSIHTRAADTRILASSGCALAVACAQRMFREDLFYRLNSMALSVPSLRERLEDISELSRMILEQLSQQFGANLPILSAGAVRKMKQYSWPGNFIELESVLFRALLSASDPVITEAEITFDPIVYDCCSRDGTAGLAGLTMAEIERRAIVETIHACGGNRALSAQKLGISEKTIYNKIKQFKLRGIV